jgi:hypothetical protein
MFTQTYASVEGHMFLVVDAVLLLLILVSGVYLPPKVRVWSYALFALCWSAIVVVAAAAQSKPFLITH